VIRVSQHKLSRLLAAGGIAAVVLLCVLPLAGQLTRQLKARDVKFPEFYENPMMGKSQTNKLKGLLMGAEGQYLSNELFLVTQMRLEHYQPDGRTNVVAKAPQCIFDNEARLAWSTGRLEVIGVNGGLRIEGNEGFQVQMTNSSLIVSNRVRTVLHQESPNRFNP